MENHTPSVSTSTASRPVLAEETAASNVRQPKVVERRSQRTQQPAGTNPLAKKISTFFTTISDKYKTYKLNRKAAYLQKSKTKATAEISEGIKSKNFTEVHGGLKRLHKAETVLIKNKGEIREYKKENYVSDTLKGISDTIVSNTHEVYKGSPKAKYLREIVDDEEKLAERVGGKSDLKKRFHKILQGLQKIRLVSSDYITRREERIEAMDSKIVESLKALRENLKSPLIPELEEQFQKRGK